MPPADHPAERDQAGEEERLMPEEAMRLIEMSADQHFHDPEVRRVCHAGTLTTEQQAMRHLVPKERDGAEEK